MDTAKPFYISPAEWHGVRMAAETEEKYFHELGWSSGDALPVGGRYIFPPPAAVFIPNPAGGATAWFFTKPFSLADLVAAVAKTWEGSSEIVLWNYLTSLQAYPMKWRISLVLRPRAYPCPQGRLDLPLRVGNCRVPEPILRRVQGCLNEHQFEMIRLVLATASAAQAVAAQLITGSAQFCASVSSLQLIPVGRDRFRVTPCTSLDCLQYIQLTEEEKERFIRLSKAFAQPDYEQYKPAVQDCLRSPNRYGYVYINVHLITNSYSGGILRHATGVLLDVSRRKIFVVEPDVSADSYQLSLAYEAALHEELSWLLDYTWDDTTADLLQTCPYSLQGVTGDKYCVLWRALLLVLLVGNPQCDLHRVLLTLSALNAQELRLLLDGYIWWVYTHLSEVLQPLGSWDKLLLSVNADALANFVGPYLA